MLPNQLIIVVMRVYIYVYIFTLPQIEATLQTSSTQHAFIFCTESLKALSIDFSDPDGTVVLAFPPPEEDVTAFLPAMCRQKHARRA